MRDLAGHISNLSDPGPAQQVKRRLCEMKVSPRPLGVSLVISGSDNPFRYLLAPLAASIAAGNVTIVATTTDYDRRVISILSPAFTEYLDQDCNFLVPNFEPSQLIIADVDQITIIGTYTPSRFSSWTSLTLS